MAISILFEEVFAAMAYEIVEYGRLSGMQKCQAVDLFLEGFGHMMTFSRDEKKKRELMSLVFDPFLFRCCVENGRVLGLLGLATHETRPIDFRRSACVQVFGKLKGALISRQMNAVFQKPVVRSEDELYIDVLVTGSAARRKGVASALLREAFAQKGYTVCYLHVFSGNRPAISLYEKHGFTVDKREKLSPMRFLGQGCPVRMKKVLGS